MKARLYRLYQSIMRLYWYLTGGRHINVFGVTVTVTPQTVFPLYRSHPLPKADHKSRIVRYGDYVQQHAIADYMSRANRPITVIEVGAHHGAYAVTVGKLLKKFGGRFIAIEPHQASFTFLRENVRLNALEDIVTCIQAGVADKAGEMWISDDGSQSQLLSIAEGGSRVQVKTLSDIINELSIDAVDLLLVDVEGAELPVLQGFPWESLPVPKTFCELHPYAWPDFDYTGDDFKRFLDEKGLRCIDMYLTEHIAFNNTDYIGPSILIEVGNRGYNKENIHMQ